MEVSASIKVIFPRTDLIMLLLQINILLCHYGKLKDRKRGDIAVPDVAKIRVYGVYGERDLRKEGKKRPWCQDQNAFIKSWELI